MVSSLVWTQDGRRSSSSGSRGPAALGTAGIPRRRPRPERRGAHRRLERRSPHKPSELRCRVPPHRYRRGSVGGTCGQCARSRPGRRRADSSRLLPPSGIGGARRRSERYRFPAGRPVPGDPRYAPIQREVIGRDVVDGDNVRGVQFRDVQELTESSSHTTRYSTPAARNRPPPRRSGWPPAGQNCGSPCPHSHARVVGRDRQTRRLLPGAELLVRLRRIEPPVLEGVALRPLSDQTEIEAGRRAPGRRVPAGLG